MEMKVFFFFNEERSPNTIVNGGMWRLTGFLTGRMGFSAFEIYRVGVSVLRLFAYVAQR